MIHISANILPSLFSDGSLWFTLPDFWCLVVLPSNKTQQAYVPLTTTHSEILHTLVWKGEITWRREVPESAILLWLTIFTHLSPNVCVLKTQMKPWNFLWHFSSLAYSVTMEHFVDSIYWPVVSIKQRKARGLPHASPTPAFLLSRLCPAFCYCSLFRRPCAYTLKPEL